MSTTFQHPWYSAQHRLGSTTTSDAPSQQNQPLDLLGQTRTDANRKGTYWENYVKLKAWERGAEVYENACCTGKVDIILEMNGELLPCDVKAKVERSKQYPGRYYQDTLNCIPEDVYMICVDPSTKQINWHTKRIPAGWEDFWK